MKIEMITKKDAILIAQTFAKAAKFDIDNNCNGDYGKIGMIRSVLFRSLDDLYYDVMSQKLREQFQEEMSYSKVFSGREAFKEYARVIVD